MLAGDMVKCKWCGLEVRRKRLAQRYCSKRCRDGASKLRSRLRSADKTSRTGLQKNQPLPLYREALTCPSKYQVKSAAYKAPKTYPSLCEKASISVLARSLNRPTVNATERPVVPELMTRIVRIETSDNPPLTQSPKGVTD
jgi:hypothetical protein